MEQARTRDWVLSRVARPGGLEALRPPRPDPRRGVARRRRARPRREDGQGATHLLAALDEMRPADLANVIHDLPAEAPRRDRRRARRRAARRRPRGAARGGPGRDPRAPRQRARRRRPRGDVARRRRRPDRRAAAGDRRAAAAADGARRGRGRPPADVLRGAHRRRHDDHRAGDPRPRRHRRRRPGARPQRRAQPVAGRAGVRRAGRRWSRRPGRLLGVAHIQRLLREPPSTLVGHVARHRHGAAARRPPASRTCAPAPGDVQPGRRARWSTRTAGCSAR